MPLQNRLREEKYTNVSASISQHERQNTLETLMDVIRTISKHPVDPSTDAEPLWLASDVPATAIKSQSGSALGIGQLPLKRVTGHFTSGRVSDLKQFLVIAGFGGFFIDWDGEFYFIVLAAVRSKGQRARRLCPPPPASCLARRRRPAWRPSPLASLSHPSCRQRSPGRVWKMSPLP